ncbi:MAG: hypothetical protein NTU53_09025 [Planctomycetota bacterium]|nr:hypothetical protein [Planctomycetota bacterium]
MPGVVSVLAAATLAFVATGLLWDWLSWGQTYTDIVTGAISWQDFDKDRDFRALYLLLGLMGIGSLLVFGLLRLVAGRCADRQVDGALSGVLGFALTPGALWLGNRLAHSDRYVLPVLPALAVLGALGLIATMLKFRRELTATGVYMMGGGGLFVILFGFMGGMGVATAICRVPGAGPSVRGVAEWVPWISASVGAAVAVAVGLGSRNVLIACRRSRVLLLAMQLPLPLLYLVLVPPPLIENGRVVDAGFQRRLLLVLGILVVGAVWRLGVRYRRERMTDPGKGGSVERALCPLCVAAIAAFVVVGPFSVPSLNPDYFHTGEQMLPWQQIVDHGRMPYSEFVPIHGLAPILRGGFNALLFRGTAATFPLADGLVLALSGIGLFLTARMMVGSGAALLIVVGSSFASDRFFMLPIVIFVLASRQLVSRPAGWLIAWGLLSVIGVSYNAAVGCATVLGTLPLAIWFAVRLGRGNTSLLLKLMGLGAAAGVAILLSPAGQVVFGLLTYLRDNQATNVTAHGIALEQYLNKRPSDMIFGANPFVWELTRSSWILVSLAGLALIGREWSRLGGQRNRPLLVLCVASLGTFVLVQPWAFGRIDPASLSRHGHLSQVAMGTILPVMLILGRSPAHLGVRLLLVAFLGGAFNFSCILGQSPSVLPARATAIRVVPAGTQLVRGADIGLPRLGKLVADRAVLDEVLQIKYILGGLLKPGETYLDLTNRSALHYHLDYPVPVLYSASLVAANEQTQLRELRQLARQRPPVALIAPGTTEGSEPLRCYRIYRDFVLRYVPIKHKKLVFLVDPARIPDAVAWGSETHLAMLDEVFLFHDLQMLPSAWGRSWGTLAGKFDRTPGMALDSRGKLQGAKEIGKGRLAAVEFTPTMSYDLSGLNIRGSEWDFLKCEFMHQRTGANYVTVLEISFSTIGHPGQFSPPVRVWCGGPRLLIPLGAQPRWLLASGVHTLRLRLSNPGACEWFTFGKAELLQLNRDATVELTISPHQPQAK